MDFTKAYQKYQDEIIKRTIELVAIPSVCVENELIDKVTYPFGYNNVRALNYVLSLAEELGFETKNIDNVCGHIEYGEGKEIFGVLCHVDVVPAIGVWTKPPFEAWVKDDYLYGRGTSDDKGPVIASLYALKTIKDLGLKLKKRIRLIIGTDEETGSRGLKRYLEVEENPTHVISPDADFPIIYGEKGISSIDFVCENDTDIDLVGGVRYNVVAPEVTFFTQDEKLKEAFKDYRKENHYIITGKSAHAMEPENGINAIKKFVEIAVKNTNSKMIKFINDNLMNSRLKDMNLDITDDEMGDLTMNIGLLEMKKECRLGINIRYPKNLDFTSFLKTISKTSEKYGIKTELKTNSESHYVNPNSSYIKALHQSYLKYTNDYSPLKTIGGGTYARGFKNGVAFGILFPGEKEVAHETDEYIKISSLMKAGVILTDAMYEMSKNSEW